MGGVQSLPGAVSPNSGLPLLLVLTLDTMDPRLAIGRSPLDRVHLLYSWTCAISDGEFSYRESKQAVEIIEYTKGGVHSDFPYEGYPVAFAPFAAELQQVAMSDQIIIKKMNRREDDPIALEEQFPNLAVPRTQIGGEPRLLQWPLPPRLCPVCRDSMPMLAAVGNTNGTPRGLFGNDFVQLLFYYCIACAVVTAINLTD